MLDRTWYSSVTDQYIFVITFAYVLMPLGVGTFFEIFFIPDGISVVP